MSWQGATFDHAAMASGYALLGAHEVLACESCHTTPSLEPLFQPTNNQDCATCHTADYETAHAGSGFPTTCATCHSDVSWDADMQDHDQLYFPIYSGDHRGEWSSCQTCHTAPENFQIFTCLTCHEHNQTKMDDVHRERQNYVYDSPACYSCHPDGDD